MTNRFLGKNSLVLGGMHFGSFWSGRMFSSSRVSWSSSQHFLLLLKHDCLNSSPILELHLLDKKKEYKKMQKKNGFQERNKPGQEIRGGLHRKYMFCYYTFYFIDLCL